MQSHLTKVISSRKKQIYQIVEKTLDNRDAYFFVLVRKHKLKAFLEIQKGQQYKISDYGEIIDWGYGTTPSKEQLKELSKKYNIKLKEDA